ncbi:MAG: YHYH protein [Devosia sp.]
MPRTQIKAANILLAAIAFVALSGGLASAHDLPLGDGKVSTSAKQGYVLSCQTRFPANAPGAQASGAWLDDEAGTWDPDLKPVVDGAVNWPSQITLSVENGQRLVRANGLPDHPTGTYPVSRSDDAYQYDRNPNTITAQQVILSLDASPSLANAPTCLPMGMIGFSLTGAAIYNALDAGGDDAPAREIQDSCNGHPEHSGEYHYHNYSSCFEDKQSGPQGHSDLIGYALDGFGMYGTHDVGGDTLHTSDLDTCHGHVGPVEWDGKIVEMYHYHFTEDYPYTLGCFAGTPAR